MKNYINLNILTKEEKDEEKREKNLKGGKII